MTAAERRWTAIAVKPNHVSLLDIDKNAIEKRGTLPFDLTLKHAFFKDCELCFDNDFSTIRDIWLDCQLNSVLLILCSKKLQDIINKHLTGNENLKWISCNIIFGHEKRVYYFPLFTELPDVLNEDNSFYGGREPILDNLIKPIFDSEKIKKHAIFPLPTTSDTWKIPPSVYICENIKRDIVKAGLQDGIYFHQALVS